MTFGPGRDLEIVDADLCAPADGEVRVRVDARGICRSDLHVAGTGESIEISPFHLLYEKQLTGSIYGSVDPHAEFPIMAEQYRQGRLPLDALTGGRHALTEVNTAFAELADHRSAPADRLATTLTSAHRSIGDLPARDEGEGPGCGSDDGVVAVGRAGFEVHDSSTG